MTLTDNELCMLEQLCYLSGSVAEEAGVAGFSGVNSGYSGMTIGEILAGFTEEALIDLEECDEVQNASGKEWADIIRYLKNSDLSSLTLSETMTNANGGTLALCFTQEGSSDAVVAFRGTYDGDEWVDNVEGLTVSDTDCQKEALDFIESLPYDDITVTGHSKGGNKAMYVAVTSDKVSRCVSFDGQGFSQEFIDKYWAEIEQKGSIITNYSLSTDYVHALMFPVPNSSQIYCQGYGVDNIAQHHSPNSFFLTDGSGNLLLDSNGQPIIVPTVEDESITMLHEFTTFVMNNADDSDKVVIVDYISQLLEMVFGDGAGTDEIIDFVLSDSDSLALIIAYLVKYMDDNDLSSEDIDKLLSALGLDSLDGIFTFSIAGIEIVGLSGLLDYVKGQLTDDNDDWIINNILLPALQKLMLSDYDIDISALWEKVNSKIKSISTSGGTSDAFAKTGVIRDFSVMTYNTLINTVLGIENISYSSVSSWSSYSSEDWYSSLHVTSAILGITTYIRKVTEADQNSRIKIDNVFDNVSSIDGRIASRLKIHCGILKGAGTAITSVADGIGG